ncbi:hypothetical protein ACNKHO_22385 [Shigella flexneri]
MPNKDADLLLIGSIPKSLKDDKKVDFAGGRDPKLGENAGTPQRFAEHLREDEDDRTASIQTEKVSSSVRWRLSWALNRRTPQTT